MSSPRWADGVLDFGLQRSIYGQIVSETGTLGTEHYGYDKAGRLTSADETPQGGQCTTRAYTYDLGSNRKSLPVGLSATQGVRVARSNSGQDGLDQNSSAIVSILMAMNGVERYGLYGLGFSMTACHQSTEGSL